VKSPLKFFRNILVTPNRIETILDAQKRLKVFVLQVLPHCWNYIMGCHHNVEFLRNLSITHDQSASMQFAAIVILKFFACGKQNSHKQEKM
jgi:hypothetical protein